MNNWAGIDYVVFLILLLNTLLGMVRGASREIISFMCLCAALIITIKFTVPLSTFLDSSPLITDTLNASFVQGFMSAIGAGSLTAAMLFQFIYAISVLILFVGTFSFLDAVLRYTGVQESFSFPYAFLSRKVGGSLGFIRGFIFTIIFLLVLQHLLANNPNNFNSFFINLFKGTVDKLNIFIADQTPEKYRELLLDRGIYDEKRLLNIVDNPDVIPKEYQEMNKQAEQLTAPAAPQQPTQQQPQQQHQGLQPSSIPY